MHLTERDIVAIKKLQDLAESFGGKLLEVKGNGDRRLSLTMKRRFTHPQFTFIFQSNRKGNIVTKWTLFSENRPGLNLTSKDVSDRSKVLKFLKAIP